MLINDNIKTTLDEIAAQSIKLYNNKDSQLKYLRRMIKVYDNLLSEEERVYLLHTLLEMIHYRNLATDPENMLTISNIKIRTLFFVFICAIILMILAAILFKVEASVLSLTVVVANFFKMFSI